jgi:hypothetical protein
MLSGVYDEGALLVTRPEIDLVRVAAGMCRTV